jgi:hypothetical protein
MQITNLTKNNVSFASSYISAFILCPYGTAGTKVESSGETAAYLHITNSRIYLGL